MNEMMNKMMLEWEKYKTTNDYKNSRKLALNENEVDESLWAAYMHGFSTAIEAIEESKRGSLVAERLSRECRQPPRNAGLSGNFRRATKILEDGDKDLSRIFDYPGGKGRDRW